MSLTRRGFVGALLGAVAATVRPGAGGAQQATLFGEMDESGYRPVRLPPKGGGASMSAEERDALEHRLHCQCGTCTLDVFTCRTTDRACPVSPAMHRDVMALVEGGHGADEIIDAFVGVYGERALMAPRPSGFNWTAWLMPFVALGGGTVLVLTILRRWLRAARARPAATAIAPPLDATPEELARLDRELRHDGA